MTEQAPTNGSIPASAETSSEQASGSNPVPTKTGTTVIIAMDGSEFSDYALQFYAESVHKPGNKVIIAHCTEFRNIKYPAVSMVSGDTMMNMLTHEINEEEKRTEAMMIVIGQKLKSLKIDAVIERVHGEPGQAVVSLADQKQADCIVVGCRGKGSMRRTLTGSVTDYIIHHSHVPIIVARHKDHMKHYHVIPNPFHK